MPLYSQQRRYWNLEFLNIARMFDKILNRYLLPTCPSINKAPLHCSVCYQTDFIAPLPGNVMSNVIQITS